MSNETKLMTIALVATLLLLAMTIGKKLGSEAGYRACLSEQDEPCRCRLTPRSVMPPWLAVP